MAKNPPIKPRFYIQAKYLKYFWGAHTKCGAIVEMEEQVLGDVQSVLSFWKDFDFDSKRVSLDKQCVEMREQKTASINGRKRLVDITKRFRAKQGEEQLLMAAEVLTSYQEEIDQLSRRSKSSEAAFYALYKAIYEAPDPVEVIESLMTRTSDSSTHVLEIEKLKNELTQYDTEFQQLTNQDITIRRLEEQLADFKDGIEDKVAEEVRKRVEQIEAAANMRVQEAKEHQISVEKRLVAALDSMREAQSLVDKSQTQMFEVSAQNEKRITALLNDNSMLVDDMQRANVRIMELELEQSRIKLQHAAQQQDVAFNPSSASPTGSPRSSPSKSGNREDTLQAVIMELQGTLREKEELMRLAKLQKESSALEATQSLSREKDMVAKLKQDLASRPTRGDLIDARKQLRILQRVAFNVEDDVDVDGVEGEDTDKGLENIEMLLVSRVKSLESDLTDLRSERDIHKTKALALEEEKHKLARDLEKQTALAARLESDLERQTDATLPSHRGITGYGSRLGSVPSGRVVGAAALGTIDLSVLLNVDSSKVPQSDKTATSINSSLNSGSGDQPSSSSTSVLAANSENNPMLSVVLGQRDRYRERLAVVEGKLVKTQRDLETVQNLQQALEKDNIQLYSKIRYLQSFGTSGASAAENSMGSSPRPGMKINRRGGGGSGSGEDSGGDVESGSVTESRYSSLYEQKISPFAIFSQSEKDRKLSELTVADRIIYNTASTIISTQGGRTIVLCYLGAMHLLIFAIMYWETHHTQRGCDPLLDHTHD